MKRIIVILAAGLALSGCADFRLGAVCYLPADHIGSCSVSPKIKFEITTPAPAPAASGVSV